jgi:hypothetical protein
MINSDRDVKVPEGFDVHARVNTDHERKTPHISRVAVRRFVVKHFLASAR